jgi:hypothetical protein
MPKFIHIVYWGDEKNLFTSVYADAEVALEFMNHCTEQNLDSHAETYEIQERPEF